MTLSIPAAPHTSLIPSNPVAAQPGGDGGDGAPVAAAFREALAAALGETRSPELSRLPNGSPTSVRRIRTTAPDARGAATSAAATTEQAAMDAAVAAATEPSTDEAQPTPAEPNPALRPPESPATPVAGALDHRSDGDTKREGSDASDVPAIVITPVSLPTLPALARIGDVHARTDSLNVLVPEFRGRLERVIARMEEEFGYTVEVIETARSQERQEALFAQGRTTPGPIVTWTRSSRHAHGLAADVTIDGGWEDRAAFERLAVIAREEGLRTLGARDPGHVELPVATASARGKSEGIAPAAAHHPAPRPGNAPPAVPGNDVVDRLFERPQPSGINGRSTDSSQVRDGVAVEREGTSLPAGKGEVRSLPLSGDVESRPPRGTRGLHLPGPDADGNLPFTGPGASPNFRELDDAGVRGGIPGPVAPLVAPLRVAEVAAVATVAPIAQVASVPRPGAAASGRRESRSDETAGPARRVPHGEDLPPRPVGEALPVQASPREVIASAEANAVSRLTSLGDRLRGEATETAAEDSVEAGFAREERSFSDLLPAFDREPEEMHTIVAEREGATRRDGPNGVSSIERTDAAERIARALRLQDSIDERPMSSVTLRLDHPEGGEDRIRVDLRGRTVGATLDITDAGAAEHMRAHTQELQHALERRGLDGERVVVRSTAEAMQGLASAAGGEREGVRTGAASHGASQHGSTPREHRASRDTNHAQRDQDQPTSRQRRDQGAPK